MNKDYFSKMVANLNATYGKLISTEFAISLKQDKVRDYLWKFTFAKNENVNSDTGSSSAENAPHREILYMVRMGVVDGKAVVAGCGFK
jgi:hypothetical protein